MRLGNGALRACLAASTVVAFILAGCSLALSAPGNVAPATEESAPTAAPAPTMDPLPSLTLTPGEKYFRLRWPAQLHLLAQPGRVQAGGLRHRWSRRRTRAAPCWCAWDSTTWPWAATRAMATPRTAMIIDRWSQNWEHFFYVAEANGVYVLPYFTGWMNWNTTGYNTWADNPFNSANGGPAASPTEIFKQDSPTQQLYLKWFTKHRGALAASPQHPGLGARQRGEPHHLHLGTAGDLPGGADGCHRTRGGRPAPTDHGLAGGHAGMVGLLPQRRGRVHQLPPVPCHPRRLDSHVLKEVPRYLAAYNKPVLIGESGLHYATPDSAGGPAGRRPERATSACGMPSGRKWSRVR